MKRWRGDRKGAEEETDWLITSCKQNHSFCCCCFPPTSANTDYTNALMAMATASQLFPSSSIPLSLSSSSPRSSPSCTYFSLTLSSPTTCELPSPQSDFLLQQSLPSSCSCSSSFCFPSSSSSSSFPSSSCYWRPRCRRFSQSCGWIGRLIRGGKRRRSALFLSRSSRVSSVVVGEVVMLEPAAAAAAALVIFLADMDPANVQTLIISASVLAATSASLYFGLKVKWKRFSLVLLF